MAAEGKNRGWRVMWIGLAPLYIYIRNDSVGDIPTIEMINSLSIRPTEGRCVVFGEERSR